MPLPIRRNWTTPFGPGEHVARTFAERVQAVIMDMRMAGMGVDGEEKARVLSSLSRYGSVNVVERIYAQLVRLDRSLDLDQLEELLRIRMDTIVERARKIQTLSTTGPREDVREKLSFLDRPRVPVNSAQGTAIALEGDAILATLWMIMKEFSSVTQPLERSIGAVTKSMQLVRALTRDIAFAETLDSMVMQILREGYKVQLPHLQKKDTLNPFSLKSLDRNTVNSLVALCAGQGDTYRVLALTEMFDSKRWIEKTMGEIGGVRKRVAPLDPIDTSVVEKSEVVAEEDDFGPTLSGETAAYDAQRKDSDMFGRPRRASAVGKMFSDVKQTLSSVASDVPGVDEYTPVLRIGSRPRRYTDFYVDDTPALKAIEDNAKMKYWNLVDPKTIPQKPKPTMWRTADMDMWRTAFHHVHDAGNVELAILLARIYIDMVKRQQAYWIHRAVSEYHRQAAIKALPESTETVSHGGSGTRSNTQTWGLERRSEGSSKDFYWPRNVQPPLSNFNADYLRIPLEMAKATKGPKAHLDQVLIMLKEVKERLRVEHRIIGGRFPCETKLDLDAYVRAMRKAPRSGRGDQTIGEMLYFTEATEAKWTEYAVIRHLHGVDQTYRRLTELVDWTVGARMHKSLKKQREKMNRAIRTLQQQEKDDRLAAREAEDEKVWGPRRHEEATSEAAQ